MVIFHSYVSLPEGIWPPVWGVLKETLHRTAAAAVAAPGCLTNGLSGRIDRNEREENGVSPFEREETPRFGHHVYHALFIFFKKKKNMFFLPFFFPIII